MLKEGDWVKVISMCYDLYRMGRIEEDDESPSLPYKVQFSEEYDDYGWFSESSLELVEGDE